MDLLYKLSRQTDWAGGWIGPKIFKKAEIFDRETNLPGLSEMAEFRRNFDFSGRNPKPRLGVVELERRVLAAGGGGRRGGVEREEVVRRLAVPCAR